MARHLKNSFRALVLIASGCYSISNASATVLNLVGNIDGYNFTGQLDLNVVGSTAVSGGGFLSGLGFSNVPIVEITTSTPGDENGSSSAPIGFRANDGTDYYLLDQAYPISTNGLLFDVGTSVAAFGAYPLFAIYSNGDGTFGASFTGNVAGMEYYNISGSVTVSSVPVPASAPMLGSALLALGAVGYCVKRKGSATA